MSHTLSGTDQNEKNMTLIVGWRGGYMREKKVETERKDERENIKYKD